MVYEYCQEVIKQINISNVCNAKANDRWEPIFITENKIYPDLDVVIVFGRNKPKSIEDKEELEAEIKKIEKERLEKKEKKDDRSEMEKFIDH
jgi:hypothetical protein